MTLTKEINWKSMAIDSTNEINIYYTLVFKEDDVELLSGTVKDVISPGDNITSYPQKIQNIINAAWA